MPPATCILLFMTLVGTVTGVCFDNTMASPPREDVRKAHLVVNIVACTMACYYTADCLAFTFNPISSMCVFLGTVKEGKCSGIGFYPHVKCVVQRLRNHSKMLRLFVLGCSITLSVFATCPMPGAVTFTARPDFWVDRQNFTIVPNGTYDVLFCPIDPLFGQMELGSQAFAFNGKLRCDTTKSRWVDETTGYEAPPFITCGEVNSASVAYCEAFDQQQSGAIAHIILIGCGENYCGAGNSLQLSNGKAVKSIKCELYSYDPVIETVDGIITNSTMPTLKCVPGPTTTTAATTTTARQDISPSYSQLWDVMYYYNYALGVHAFCADSACVNVIQKNGIGYDMVNGKGSLGKAIKESAIAAVRAACPAGSQQLRNLGFTKSGYKYVHNLNGSGLKQGWVAVVKGACGASIPIRRWKSRYSEDMMYGYDLEWNTWYKGMVQDGGQVHFYLF